MPNVAVYDDFLRAFSQLGRARQRKVREFNRKFIAWPNAPHFAMEAPPGARDPRVRTVRVSPDTSAVVLSPERGELFILLWLADLAAANDWASRRTFSVHEATGALQVYDMDSLASFQRPLHDPGLQPDLAEGKGVPRRSPRAILSALEDAELLSLGVPRVLLPAVRAVKGLAGLRELAPHLPAEAHECLVRLAAGYELDEVRAYVEPGRPPSDSSDLETALEHPDSRRRFAKVRSPEDLEAMLEEPLARWRLFLHPSQEDLVQRDYAGPARVLGGAGTGKTVVAMHRARHLARGVFSASTDRILFTTFNVNLAQNLRELMQTFCGKELSRIDIVNLHSWATQYVAAHALQVGPVEDSGGKLNWGPVLEAVRRHVEARPAGALPLYRSAVVDEAQDFGPEELKLVRALVPPGPNDLFLVGDAHQRIYGQPVKLSHLGIDVRGRTSTLRLNYRTTEQIRDWAVDILEGLPIDDMDGGTDPQSGYVSLLQGVEPEVRVQADEQQERSFVAETLGQMARDYPLDNICVVARTHAALTSVAEPALKQARLPFARLEKTADREAGPGVRVATMHRVKGLEFSCVVVVGLTAELMPLRPAGWASLDLGGREASDRKERCLLYVASTRARERLVLSAGGQPSEFLAQCALRPH